MNILEKKIKNIFEKLFGGYEPENKIDIEVDEQLRLYLHELLEHEYPKTALYSKDVSVMLWLPEMNGVNVTMFYDAFLKKYDTPNGYVFLVTSKDNIDCLSVLNIDAQSSGFRFVKKICGDKKDMLIMQVCPANVKQELNIPDDYEQGFVWGNNRPGKSIPSHGVDCSKYKNNYILNFSVSGEFNLNVFYLPLSGDGLVHLYANSFECK